MMDNEGMQRNQATISSQDKKDIDLMQTSKSAKVPKRLSCTLCEQNDGHAHFDPDQLHTDPTINLISLDQRVILTNLSKSQGDQYCHGHGIPKTCPSP